MNDQGLLDSFHYAVARGHLTIVDRLVSNNFNLDVNSLVNSQDGNGNTALYHACRVGNAQMAIKLLAAGADPQILSLDGETPLYAAILSQNVKIVRALIEANPVVLAARDHLGATPLHWAAESGCEEIVKEILEVIKQVKGETAWHRYRMTTFTKRAIIETGTLEAVNREGETPLFVAAQTGRTEVVHMLLNAQANVRVRNKLGKTVIDWAITKTTVDVVSRLLDAGAIADGDYGNRQSPLHRVALGGTPEVIKLLLKRKVDINARGAEGMTPLHWAACSKNTENLKVLLEAGSDVKARASGNGICTGLTALHFAAGQGTPEGLRILLDAGADIEERCKQGGTALHHALKASSDDNLTLKMVVVLISAGAVLDAQDFEGNTALHYGAGEGQRCPKPLTVKQLLTAGVDPSKRNLTGHTAVVLAAKCGDQHTIEIFRDANLIEVQFSIRFAEAGMYCMLRSAS